MVMRLLSFPSRSRVVEIKVIPFEFPGLIKDGVYLLDGSHGRQRDLLDRDGVEEEELGAGVGGDEPPVRRADDVALPDGRVRETHLVSIFVGEAEELGGAGAGGSGGVEKAGGLGPLVDAKAADGAGGGAPGGADNGGLKEIREL